MTAVAVYGTLKKGKHNHGWLQGSKFIGKCFIPNTTMYISGLPYLTLTEGDGCYAELYDVNDSVLRGLDRLEGHPDFYRRVVLPVVELETGHKATAWCYVHPDEFAGTTARIAWSY